MSSTEFSKRPPETKISLTGNDDILLISCYELGQQPLGVITLAARLTSLNYKPNIADLAISPISSAPIATAKLIGISVPMLTALRLGCLALKTIKKLNPNCHVIFYGLYASLNEAYLKTLGVHQCYGGEFIEPFLAQVNKLQHITTKAKAVNETKPSVVYNRHALPPLEQYAKLILNNKQYTVGHVASTRGCKHTCLHCPITPIYNGKFYAHKASDVIEEIRNLVAAGAKHITFGDPDFLNGPTHALRITQSMHDNFSDITFDFTTKIEHILKYPKQIRVLKENGALYLISAIESFNDVVLKNLNKGHTEADIHKAIDFLNDIDLPLRPSLVPFTPWETLASYNMLLDTLVARQLVDQIEPVHLSIRLLIPPGSALLESASMKPYLTTLNQEAFSWQWHHPNLAMDQLAQAVSKIIDDDTASGVDPLMTFDSVRALAKEMLTGTPQKRVARLIDKDRPRPPRLTETWFCCAEPNKQQLSAFTINDQDCCSAGSSTENNCC